MIRVDTSVWEDHLRRGDAQLAALLEGGAVVVHPFIIGEIACGNLANRREVLGLLRDLPMAVVAGDDEVLGFIDLHRLHGKGIGYVDAHLLTAVALTAAAVRGCRSGQEQGHRRRSRPPPLHRPRNRGRGRSQPQPGAVPETAILAKAFSGAPA